MLDSLGTARVVPCVSRQLKAFPYPNRSAAAGKDAGPRPGRARRRKSSGQTPRRGVGSHHGVDGPAARRDGGSRRGESQDGRLTVSKALEADRVDSRSAPRRSDTSSPLARPPTASISELRQGSVPLERPRLITWIPGCRTQALGRIQRDRARGQMVADASPQPIESRRESGCLRWLVRRLPAEDLTDWQAPTMKPASGPNKRLTMMIRPTAPRDRQRADPSIGATSP